MPYGPTAGSSPVQSDACVSEADGQPGKLGTQAACVPGDHNSSGQSCAATGKCCNTRPGASVASLPAYGSSYMSGQVGYEQLLHHVVRLEVHHRGFQA